MYELFVKSAQIGWCPLWFRIYASSEHGRTMFAPTDVCGVIKGCEINNNAKCQGGGLSRAPAPTFDCYGLLCRKIATLFADLHLLRARVGGADFVLRYYIYNSTYFLLLFSLNLHLVGLRRMRLCLKLRKGLCPLTLQAL